jgi:hypothetical protein
MIKDTDVLRCKLLAACAGTPGGLAIDGRARGVPPGTRLVLEKPFGTDLSSARQLNEVLARRLPTDFFTLVTNRNGHRVSAYPGLM